MVCLSRESTETSFFINHLRPSGCGNFVCLGFLLVLICQFSPSSSIPRSCLSFIPHPRSDASLCGGPLSTCCTILLEHLKMLKAAESDLPPIAELQDKDSGPVQKPGRAGTVARINRACKVDGLSKHKSQTHTSWFRLLRGSPPTLLF